MKKTVLIPLPDNDFELTEVSIPWKNFVANNIEVVFSTENGKVAKTDPLVISGALFGQIGAKKEDIKIYKEMEKSIAFLNPIKYSEIDVDKFDALLLAGGHAQGMKQYLESKVLQVKVVDFFKKQKIIGAVCHGPIVLIRTINPETGKSVIHQRKVTALIKFLEKLAYYLTFWKLGNHFRTYPEYVEDEIKNNLENKNNFLTGGNPWKPFFVEDKNLLTARWPNDVPLFSKKLTEKILEVK